MSGAAAPPAELVQQVVECGFTEGQAVNALGNNQLQRAMSLLLSGALDMPATATATTTTVHAEIKAAGARGGSGESSRERELVATGPFGILTDRPFWALDLIAMFNNSPDAVDAVERKHPELAALRDKHLCDLNFAQQEAIINTMSELEASKDVLKLEEEPDAVVGKHMHAAHVAANAGRTGPRAAVLQCKGCYAGSSRHLLEAVQNANSGAFSFSYAARVTAAEVAAGALAAFDVLLVPGGDHGQSESVFAPNCVVSAEGMMDALGPRGQWQIREWVRSGGGYFGVCGGTYLAEWLCMASIYIVGTNKGPGCHGSVEVELLPAFSSTLSQIQRASATSSATAVGAAAAVPSASADTERKTEIAPQDIEAEVGVIDKRPRWVFDNGPLIYPIALDGMPMPTPLALLREDMPAAALAADAARTAADGTWRCWNCFHINPRSATSCTAGAQCTAVKARPGVANLPVGIMAATPAVVTTTFGKGRLVLFATHPEHGSPRVAAAFARWACDVRPDELKLGTRLEQKSLPKVRTTRYGYAVFDDAPMCLKERADMRLTSADKDDIVRQWHSRSHR